MNRLSLIALVVGVSLTANGMVMARGGGGGGRGGFGGGHGGHGGHGMSRGGHHSAPARSHHVSQAPRVVSRPVAAPARPLASHVRVAAPISRSTPRAAQPVARAGKTISGTAISLTSRSVTAAARTLTAQTTRTLQRVAATAGLNAATRAALGAALGGRALSLRQRMLLMVAARNNRGLSAAERGALADDLAGDDDMLEEGEMGDDVDAQEPEPLFGMEIQDMSDGPALSQGMKVGDIILAINGLATPDFDSLRSALEAAGRQADVVFINVDNGQTERVMLPVEDTRLGVNVEQVQVN